MGEVFTQLRRSEHAAIARAIGQATAGFGHAGRNTIIKQVIPFKLLI